jgi:hypothetical protein
MNQFKTPLIISAITLIIIAATAVISILGTFCYIDPSGRRIEDMAQIFTLEKEIITLNSKLSQSQAGYEKIMRTLSEEKARNSQLKESLVATSADGVLFETIPADEVEDESL